MDVDPPSEDHVSQVERSAPTQVERSSPTLFDCQAAAKDTSTFSSSSNDDTTTQGPNYQVLASLTPLPLETSGSFLTTDHEMDLTPDDPPTKHIEDKASDLCLDTLRLSIPAKGEEDEIIDMGLTASRIGSEIDEDDLEFLDGTTADGHRNLNIEYPLATYDPNAEEPDMGPSGDAETTDGEMATSLATSEQLRRLGVRHIPFPGTEIRSGGVTLDLPPSDVYKCRPFPCVLTAVIDDGSLLTVGEGKLGNTPYADLKVRFDHGQTTTPNVRIELRVMKDITQPLPGSDDTTASLETPYYVFSAQYNTGFVFRRDISSQALEKLKWTTYADLRDTEPGAIPDYLLADFRHLFKLDAVEAYESRMWLFAFKSIAPVLFLQPQSVQEVMVGRSARWVKDTMRIVQGLATTSPQLAITYDKPVNGLNDRYITTAYTTLMRAFREAFPQYHAWRDNRGRYIDEAGRLLDAQKIGNGMLNNKEVLQADGTYNTTVKSLGPYLQFGNITDYQVVMSTSEIRETRYNQALQNAIASTNHACWIVRPGETYQPDDSNPDPHMSNDGLRKVYRIYVRLAAAFLEESQDRIPKNGDIVELRFCNTAGLFDDIRTVWRGPVRQLADPITGTHLIITATREESSSSHAFYPDLGTAMQQSATGIPVQVSIRLNNKPLNQVMRAISSLTLGKASQLRSVLMGDFREAVRPSASRLARSQNAGFRQKVAQQLNPWLVQCFPHLIDNAAQVESIMSVLRGSYFTLIQGPPGTGKTEVTAANMWAHVALLNEKVLVTSGSKVVLDEVASRLDRQRPKGSTDQVIRLHVPSAELASARGDKQVNHKHLEAMNKAAVADLQADNKEMLNLIDEAWDRRTTYYVKNNMSLAQAVSSLARSLTDMKANDSALLTDDDSDYLTAATGYLEIVGATGIPDLTPRQMDMFKMFFDQLAQKALKDANIVLTTCLTTGDRNLMRCFKPDIIFVDEAAQVAEVDILVAFTNFPKAKQIVLIGDHMQLLPGCSSGPANEFAGNRRLSLFERLVRLGVKPTMLDTQFRMTVNISNMPSALFYESRLISAPAMRVPGEITMLLRTLTRLIAAGKFASKDHPFNPSELVFFDIKESQAWKSKTGPSLENYPNARFIALHIKTMLSNQAIRATDIGIITLYSAQQAVIRGEILKIFEGKEGQPIAKALSFASLENPEDLVKMLTYSTVDGFQGSEKMIILLDLVTTGSFRIGSNKRQMTSFGRDSHRLCVALTRAKVGLFIYGNARAIEESCQQTHAPKLLQMLRYLQARSFVIHLAGLKDTAPQLRDRQAQDAEENIRTIGQNRAYQDILARYRGDARPTHTLGGLSLVRRTGSVAPAPVEDEYPYPQRGRGTGRRGRGTRGARGGQGRRGTGET